MTLDQYCATRILMGEAYRWTVLYADVLHGDQTLRTAIDALDPYYNPFAAPLTGNQLVEGFIRDMTPEHLLSPLVEKDC